MTKLDINTKIVILTVASLLVIGNIVNLSNGLTENRLNLAIHSSGKNTWKNMASTGPTARAAHQMVYNSLYQKVILFGGHNGTGTYCDDTWVYDLITNTWTEKNPTTKPSGRFNHAMVYDSNSDKVILFGGYDGSNQVNDTWAYDFISDDWTQMNPSSAPSTRWRHSMVYDSFGKVILFGGRNITGYFMNKTWVYDYPSNTWTPMNPSSTPPGRADCTIVHDSNFRKDILFGGTNFSTDPFTDTWVYDFTTNTWTQMNPSTAPRTSEHAMVYDSTSTKVVLVGGFSSDTWVYDLDTTNEENVTLGTSIESSVEPLSSSFPGFFVILIFLGALVVVIRKTKKT